MMRDVWGEHAMMREMFVRCSCLSVGYVGAACWARAGPTCLGRIARACEAPLHLACNCGAHCDYGM